MSVSPITWRQIQEQAPDDGERREAIGSELHVTPAPSMRKRDRRDLPLEDIRPGGVNRPSRFT